MIQPRTWWRSLPLAERVPLVLAALALLVGVGLRSAARLVSTDFALHLACPVPELAPTRGLDDPGPIAVDHGVVHDELLDAWGRPWRFERHTVYERVLLYSVGPDGQDDQGVGDDVRMVFSPAFGVLAGAPWIGAGAALLGLWVWFVLRAALARRAPALWLEAWRALVLVSPLTCAAVCVGAGLGRLANQLVDSPWLLVSPATALAATFALVLWLGGLALRLRRPAAEDPEAPVSWRRPAVVAALALVVVGLTAVWAWWDHTAFARRRLLARACLGLDWQAQLVREGDDDLVRSFLRRNSPLARAEGLSDPDLAAFGRIGGADANAFLARALARAPSAEIDFHVERTAPWQHLRGHDPRLETLLATVAKDPQRHRGLIVTRPGLFASRFGRRAALSALAQSLADARSVGAFQGRHEVRACDHAAYAVTRLFTSAMPFRWPEAPADAQQIDTPYWDAVVRRTRDWLKSEPVLAPASWIVVEVRGASVVSGSSRVDVKGGGLNASFDALGPDHLLVSGPHEAFFRTQTVRVTDAGSGRASSVSVYVRPNETTWVVVDLARGTTTTHTQAVPP